MVREGKGIHDVEVYQAEVSVCVCGQGLTSQLHTLSTRGVARNFRQGVR